MAQYLTKEGLSKIKKELEYLKNVKRKEIAETLQIAASFGDLKENFAYHQAKDEQAFLEGRILELEGKVRDSQIIEKQSSDKAQIGSVVELSAGKKNQKFQIVGREEADPTKDKISFESPLGEALLGKSLGDKVEIDSADGKINYKIVKIE